MVEWAAHLVDTRTGQLGARLDLVGGGTWTETVNAAEDATLNVDKASLHRVRAEHWMLPWDNSVLLTVDGEPLLFGPLTSLPDFAKSTVTLKVGGALSLLAYRRGTTDFRPGQGRALAASQISLSRMSLGSIMWRLVEAAITRRGGSLPIVHGSPDETGLATGGHERTYKGFDVANLEVAHLLGLLSEVIGGPDFAFRPRWGDETRRRVEWVFVHGTNASPRLVQTRMLSIDETARLGAVTDFTVAGNYTPINRVVATGAGADKGTLLVIAEKPEMWARTPLLETTWSDTSAESADLLTRHGMARITDSELITMQVNATIQPGAAMPITGWRAGDDAMVTVSPEWWPWPAGRQQMTLIKRSGVVGSSQVTIEAQRAVHVSQLARGVADGLL